MEESIKQTIDKWLQSNIDEQDKRALEEWLKTENENEIIDAFYKELEFGTGGLRGVMGLGSNRMNKYTVGSATQGLANYINAQCPHAEASVAIAHDSRNNSDYFAKITADILSANGIKVFLFDELRPTPELSFAIRQLGCISGIVVTASHNPKEYNGYKVYWDDGAQIIAPHDARIIAEVRKITSFDQVKFTPKPELIQSIGEEIDQQYLETLSKLSLSTDAIKNQSNLSIVFSPIHGTGITLIPQALEQFGFTQVHVIEEQATPDGNFPTVVYPNPEEKDALRLSLEKAKQLDAELVMATDPDADRVGIAIKNKSGDFDLLNGNQTGALLIYYLCLKWKENGQLDGNQYVVKTVVTTELIKDIASHFGVPCYDTLTGFKHIAGLIKKLEGQKTFIGGGEESYGYLISDFVRDKDAVASCAMIAEMAAWAKDHGKSLNDILEEVYTQFGMYQEDLISLTKKGKSGAEEIQEMMSTFRNHPPAALAGSAIEWLIDYKSSVSKNLLTNEEQKIDFPVSNVLQFITKDGSKISMRPSGTEPKIKFYISVRANADSADRFEAEKLHLRDKITKIKEELDLS